MKVESLSYILFIVISFVINFLSTSVTAELTEEHRPTHLIRNLTDATFETMVKNGNPNPWLVVFHLKSCYYCRNALKNLKEYARNNALEEIKLGKVDCDQNMFSCLRFNITKVPYIVIIQNNKMYELTKPATNADVFTNFINEERVFESGEEIPQSIGMLWFLYRNVEEAFLLFHSWISPIVKENVGDNINWTIYHSVGLIIGVLVFILILEIYILSYCFRSKKLPRNKTEVTTTPKTSDPGSQDGNNNTNEDKIKKE